MSGACGIRQAKAAVEVLRTVKIPKVTSSPIAPLPKRLNDRQWRFIVTSETLANPKDAMRKGRSGMMMQTLPRAAP
jgi:hypothetical protein